MTLQSAPNAPPEQPEAPMPGKIILVGKSEIAERLNVSVKAVERWMQTPETGFPEPGWRLAMGPVWRWTTIKAWSKRSGYPKPLYNRSEPPEE